MKKIVQQIARDAFYPEYMLCLSSLSQAVTAYAEACLPDALRNPSADISPYLYRGVTMGVRYQSGQAVEIADQNGIFPPVRQIPLARPVVSRPFPATVTLELSCPEGIAVESALVALSEMLGRVDEYIESVTAKMEFAA